MVNENEQIRNDMPADGGPQLKTWDSVAEPAQNDIAATAQEEAEVVPHTFAEFNKKIEESNIEILKQLNSTNPEAKFEFLSSQITERRPRNEYGNLDASLCEKNLERLGTVEAQIESAELPYREKLLLREELARTTKKNRLALATAKYNLATTPEERQAAQAEQQAANVKMYGMPDEDTFYALLKQKLSKINVESLSPEDRKQYDELLNMLGELPEESKPLYAPRQETIDKFAEMVKLFYEPFLKHIPEDKEIFTVQEVADIVNEIIADEIGDKTETGWSAVVIPNAAMASVNAKTKQVKFPGARSKGDYTKKDLEKIIMHELGVHALRSIVTEDSTIKAFRLASVGGNEVFEEGIAKAIEQSLEGKFDDPSSMAPSRYIMISLANLRHTDFRDTFEIMKRLEHLTGGMNEGTIYDNVQRVYRGTGVLTNNKDLAYYDGNIMAWKYIEKHIDDPDFFDRIFLSGKMDPQNPDQEYISYEMKSGAIGQHETSYVPEVDYIPEIDDSAPENVVS